MKFIRGGGCFGHGSVAYRLFHSAGSLPLHHLGVIFSQTLSVSLVRRCSTGSRGGDWGLGGLDLTPLNAGKALLCHHLC